MTAISSTTNTNAISSLQSATGGATSDTKKAAEAQDRFLTLLVTQLKNQDPLSPLDNAQVTSQLAQLSTVEGIDKLNASVAGLQSSYQNSQVLQSANLIGHGVLAPGKALTLSSGAAVFGVELTEPADDVTVTIKDGSGNAVHKVDLGPRDIGTSPLSWDGVGDSGAKLPDGNYRLEVSATRGGKAVSGVSSLQFGQVGSVSSSNNAVKLNVPGLGALDLSTVRQFL
jgi:flagellar basal-body rod modification protein FlgD